MFSWRFLLIVEIHCHLHIDQVLSLVAVLLEILSSLSDVSCDLSAAEIG